MKKPLKLASAALLAVIAGHAMAADDNVDVKVTGQIVPPACVPAVSGGAVFDYGTIKAGSLKKDDFNVLSKKELNFSLTCNYPMKVAFISTDGRVGTVVSGGGSMGIKDSDTSKFFGLGQVDGKNIGNYAMGISNTGLQIDGETGFVGIQSKDNGTTWTAGDFKGIWMDQQYISSIAKTGTTEPVAFTTMNGQIITQPVINKAAELDLTKIINLDGQVSVQVIYL
ncbi:hypothetical protein A3N42_19295 [Klebsiella aerogenes]|uniref:DUF1120 domain-containing protein n=1 Tax=Klebsiella aerogenes TaxID=548 RepID=UPI0007B3D751|nr:DUF1120 domain-containing protein [Klebsiella aerogenes]KZQ00375.1 hypothetical protein A3N42_19295 [Klebsiella aerogenes]